MTWIDLRDIWLACQNFKATMKRLQPDCKSSVANLDHAITDMVRQHRDDSIPEANERLLEDHLSSSYRPDIDETDVLDWTSKLRSLTMQTEAITQAHGEGDKKSEESPSAEDDGGSLQSRGTSRSMTGNETKEFSMRQSGKEGCEPALEPRIERSMSRGASIPSTYGTQRAADFSGSNVEWELRRN